MAARSEPLPVPTDVPALVAGLVTVTAWASAFVGIRSAGHTLSPGSIALGRLLVSSALLGAVALWRREPMPARRDLARIAVFGVLWLGVYSVTLNAAERRVDAGTAAMLVNVGPILIALLAGLLLHEGFPRGLFAGIAIAFGGCVLIGVGTTGSSSDAGLGIALCLVAALAYSVAVIVQKTALARVSPFTVTWLGCTAATIACLPFSATLIPDLGEASTSAILWTVYLGAVPTALGFATWAFALGRTTAGRLGSLTYLAPPIAIGLGWLILGERPAWLAIGGGAVCLVGVAIARRR
jgi:drug/metabolite transporter (DMT)-like permease